MRIRFWGTRGSLATPGPTTLRYGGNTACVEARANDGTLIVLDCGTGAHRLGQALMATDGETALRIARSVRPSLILLDWLMPGLDGTDVTRALRAEGDPYFRDVPIVLITAEAGAAKTQEGFAAGVTDYLTKPFKAPFVRARVRAWLERVGGESDRGA